MQLKVFVEGLKANSKLTHDDIQATVQNAVSAALDNHDLVKDSGIVTVQVSEDDSANKVAQNTSAQGSGLDAGKSNPVKDANQSTARQGMTTSKS